MRVIGPGGESLTTDMVRSVGGTASAPSPGWLLRAAEASCVATLIAMRAAQVRIVLDELEVTVDSESDDRGILGVDESVRSGPLSGRVAVWIARGRRVGGGPARDRRVGYRALSGLRRDRERRPAHEGDRHRRMSASATVLEPLLRTIPELDSGELVIAPLGGGITNHNYLVTVAGRTDRVVVRVPGRDTHLLGIDRDAEVAATRSAAAIGIGPEVVAYLAADGLLVTRYLPGRVLEPADLSTPGVLMRLARALRTLHAGPALAGVFDPIATARTYVDRARDRGVVPTHLALEADRVAERIAATHLLDDFEPAPCHNDLLAPNLIDDGDTIRIVDWEYAAMGDPRFDLANLVANNELAGPAVESLLTAHDGHPPDERRLAQLTLMRVLSDFREAAWGVLQQAISSLDEDFVAYADRHFERMLTVAAGSDVRRRDPPGRVDIGLSGDIADGRARVEHARAVVIGGGVGGTSVAYHLAARGWRDVVLLDRAELTSGSTFHSAGLVGQLRSSVTLTRMMVYGVELYRRLAAETGTDPGWREVGSLRLASSVERMEELQRQAGWASAFGLPLELVGPDEAHDRFQLDVDRRGSRSRLAADRWLARPVRTGARAGGWRAVGRGGRSASTIGSSRSSSKGAASRASRSSTRASATRSRPRSSSTPEACSRPSSVGSSA